MIYLFYLGVRIFGRLERRLETRQFNHFQLWHMTGDSPHPLTFTIMPLEPSGPTLHSSDKYSTALGEISQAGLRGLNLRRGLLTLFFLILGGTC